MTPRGINKTSSRIVFSIAVLLIACTYTFTGCSNLRDGRFLISVLNKSSDKIQVYVASEPQLPTLGPSASYRFEAIVPCRWNQNTTGPDYCRQRFTIHAVNLRTGKASEQKSVSADESRIIEITFRDSDFK